ncbi:hypothetical protein [Acaryochloris marina]|uniref:hypothetical protein n=1 Tax=Acaryochloris marina TaxID=155978 RepID=UPI001BB00E1E|nr:hypothetical protein [Acaryochloris marina]QUY40560.1 hypothetical protein I1H34_14555 [Acaryochloris marina S15]
MTNDSIEPRIDLESEALQYKKLHELGNCAQAAGLIVGHGHHQGKYEILRQGQALMMTPKEAQAFLLELLQSIEASE